MKHAIVDQTLQNTILDVARQRDYPVFLNTTCAISYVLGQAEYSGIFRKHYRRDLCSPANCPLSQRGLCATFMQSNKIPSQELLGEVAQYLSISPEFVKYNEQDEVITIKTLLTDAEERFLSQATGFLFRSEQTQQTLEWSIATNRDSQPLERRPKKNANSA